MPDIFKNVLNYSRSVALDRVEFCSRMIDEGFNKPSSRSAKFCLESKVSRELIPFVHAVVKTMPANDNVDKAKDQWLEIMSSMY